MSRLRTLAAVVVAVVVTVAVASLLVPGVVAAVAPAWLVPPPESRAAAAGRVLLPVGLLALAAAGYVAARLASPHRPSPALERPVERGESGAVDTVGRRYRQQRARAAREWATPGESPDDSALQERLRAAAAEAHALGDGLEREAARTAVRSGTWTDDPVAAWLLATDEAGAELPPIARLRVRLLPGRSYPAFVDRTVAAIDRARGDA